MKLLIAEDEDAIRNGMERYIKLHTNRFEKIYLADNGQEALDIIFRHRPELMLLDVQMPEKNGIEVMQEAARVQCLPLTVILSGYDDFKYAQQALKLGAQDYLLKPSRSSDILQCLNRIADKLGSEPARPDPLAARDVVERAKEYIEEHFDKNLTLNQVAEYVGISHGYLSTLFSQHEGCGFVDYLHRLRIQKACVYLEQNYFKTYEIAYKVGFRDEKYFSKVFRKVMGMPPSRYKKS